jgi:sterol desaturase/sphingolipid hydroxylase (fatty acid hydroxylase superfamily)
MWYFRTVLDLLLRHGRLMANDLARNGVGVLLALAIAAVLRTWGRAHLVNKDLPIRNRDYLVDLGLYVVVTFSVLPLVVFLRDQWVAALPTLAEYHLGFLTLLRRRVGGLAWTWQFVVFFLAQDFARYWVHRLQHTTLFWRFHIVHHSARDVDWSTAWRFHFGDAFASFIPGLVLAAVLDVRPTVALVFWTLNGVSSILAHLNVDWDFGPLRRVVVNPAFHRWHHSMEVGKVSNFGDVLCVWDILFGTAYLPLEKYPRKFGVEESVPRNLAAILLYPFTKRAGRGAASAVEADAIGVPVRVGSHGQRSR